MLVLARKADESLEFPELGVVIRVISLKKTKVHLGIDAPQRIKIRRTELPPESSGQEPESSGQEPGSAERKPSAKSLRRSFESHRLSHELSRLESQIAALTELASRSNRQLAAQVAGDSQKQIEKINRLLLLVSDSASRDVTVTSSQNSVWPTVSTIDEPCVRQSSVAYTVGDSNDDSHIEPIYQLACEKAVWFPGNMDEPDRAIAS